MKIGAGIATGASAASTGFAALTVRLTTFFAVGAVVFFDLDFDDFDDFELGWLMRSPENS